MKSGVNMRRRQVTDDSARLFLITQLTQESSTHLESTLAYAEALIPTRSQGASTSADLKVAPEEDFFFPELSQISCASDVLIKLL